MQQCELKISKLTFKSIITKDSKYIENITYVYIINLIKLVIDKFFFNLLITSLSTLQHDFFPMKPMLVLSYALKLKALSYVIFYTHTYILAHSNCKEKIVYLCALHIKN